MGTNILSNVSQSPAPIHPDQDTPDKTPRPAVKISHASAEFPAHSCWKSDNRCEQTGRQSSLPPLPYCRPLRLVQIAKGTPVPADWPAACCYWNCCTPGVPP